MSIKEEVLPHTEFERLQRWLNDPACDVFRRIIESKVLLHEAKAVEHLMKSNDQTADRLEKVASGDLLDAQRASYVLELIKQMRVAKKFVVAVAVPTSII